MQHSALSQQQFQILVVQGKSQEKASVSREVMEESSRNTIEIVNKLVRKFFFREYQSVQLRLAETVDEGATLCDIEVSIEQPHQD
jgi:hypothetical protein